MASTESSPVSPQHIVIVGAGFGGLYAAKALSQDPAFRVTVIDKRNYHLFQPLLYQVATGKLAPSDIATPIRHVLRGRPNVRVVQGAAVDLDPVARKVILNGGAEIGYDILLAATGVKHSYFGNDAWREDAPGLKTVEHALEMRQRIFSAFEAAELSQDPAEQARLMTFVVVGGGPTGVELAGAIGELAQHTLKDEFRHIDTRRTRIVLAEGAPQVLSSYPADLAAAAERSLKKLGVEVLTRTLVTHIDAEGARLKMPDGTEQVVEASTVLWAAGVRASRFGQALANRVQCTLDRAGKVEVNADLSLPAHPEIFVIGDLAHYAPDGAAALPGVAPVAMQQGAYVARLLKARQRGRSLGPFRYRNQGSMAVIGRHAAVGDLRFMHVTGITAWYLWVLVHMMGLIEFGNRVVVMTRWAWNYLTRNSGSRLITSVPEARTGHADRAHRSRD
ncbi:MAG: NAD(P)/FAD-dependent oxidoreductase [Candidatus Macondimonas sp.]|jgi:NADH dehydrogenase